MMREQEQGRTPRSIHTDTEQSRTGGTANAPSAAGFRDRLVLDGKSQITIGELAPFMTEDTPVEVRTLAEKLLDVCDRLRPLEAALAEQQDCLQRVTNLTATLDELAANWTKASNIRQALSPGRFNGDKVVAERDSLRQILLLHVAREFLVPDIAMLVIQDRHSSELTCADFVKSRARLTEDSFPVTLRVTTASAVTSCVITTPADIHNHFTELPSTLGIQSGSDDGIETLNGTIENIFYTSGGLCRFDSESQRISGLGQGQQEIGRIIENLLNQLDGLPPSLCRSELSIIFKIGTHLSERAAWVTRLRKADSEILKIESEIDPGNMRSVRRILADSLNLTLSDARPCVAHRHTTNPAKYLLSMENDPLFRVEPDGSISAVGADKKTAPCRLLKASAIPIGELVPQLRASGVVSDGDFITAKGAMLTGTSRSLASYACWLVTQGETVLDPSALNRALDRRSSESSEAIDTQSEVSTQARTWGQSILALLRPERIVPGVLLGSGLSYTAYVFGSVVIAEPNLIDNATYVFSMEAFFQSQPDGLRYWSKQRLNAENPTGFTGTVQHPSEDASGRDKWLKDLREHLPETAKTTLDQVLKTMENP